LGLSAPVHLEQISIIFPVLGAILSGAACGNHLSPFADTTMMTAASTGVEPLEHAQTQFIYAVPVIVGTCVSFVVAGITNGSGLWSSCMMASGAGFGVMAVVFLILIYAKK
jgi:Na+/H+ antiporter NhaC